ncbi:MULTISPECIES: enoyl-CoA hydratase-related protein [Nocardiaceae]|uniref:Enoyl-CoA hydratase-related protein n=1 Tax=Rhodococcus cercidiphylli TaxID=489916 RepID=A0ABU4AWD6_9NOCA|nr:MULTISPECIES: enoyl-CoA hydratase-related protein [Rhodococcus]KJV03531.1 putative enoyl-CoA hydratase [Rhodococcus sp. PML026]MDV6230547.1 enoyl-CoA hydratase-related protein [Rhodococcus cercidiphylli]
MTTDAPAVNDQAGIDDAEVLVSRRGNVMLIVMNRPKARNAVNEALCLAVGDALEEADNDPNVRVVVLTGAGDKAFCAGADLKAIARGEGIIPPGREAWGLAGWVGHAISKPTIAAVNGPALGGGTEIVLAADLVVAADTATFGLPEAKRGLVAGAGGAFRLAAKIPPVVAMEMLLTGEPIDARRALELNLVNRVVPYDRLLDTALELAEQIAANAPLSVQAHKRIALGQHPDGSRPSEEAGWAITSTESQATSASADAKEGPAAFAEKRAPVWTGR